MCQWTRDELAENRTPASLPALIAEAAARDAGAVAVSEPGREDFTHARLLDGMNDATQTLRRLGIRRADRVATVLSAGAASAFGFLAVASAAVAAPLNPAYRRDEFEFFL
jgi:oxalate---CoA ligase